MSSNTPKEYDDNIEQLAEDDDEDDDDDNVSTSASNQSDASENEIPIWVRGEQRWISGVSEQTTCSDLVEALLMDEGTFGGFGKSIHADDFVIIERWRKVEQILESDTKIWKIWSAWGEAQSEVRLTLHRIDNCNRRQGNGDGDSGCGSPTGSINSAIERRRRHRASKSTSAWLTQAQTIHPKSQKATIEKLMKLILEQGETIQQQLSKLRDKELQISKIEEDRHKLREKEHGKNYLLETYLKGLHEAIDDKEITNGNSDSGIHTEDTTESTTSPEMGTSASPNIQIEEESESKNKIYSRKKSRREQNLLKEHETIKSDLVHEDIEDDESSNGVSTQIEMLEKLVNINKKLQREEELMLRLTVKIRRYEYENPSLTEVEIQNEIDRLNVEINQSNCEALKTEKQIEAYDEILKMKTNFLDQLTDELEQDETNIYTIDENSPPPIPPPPAPQIELQLLSEQQSPNFIPNNSNKIITNDEKMYIRHTPDLILSENENINICNSNNYDYLDSVVLRPPPQFSNLTEVQIHSIPKSQISNNNNVHNHLQQHQNEQQKYFTTSNNYNNLLLTNSIDLLEKCDQRNFNNFNNNTNFYLNSSNLKLGPKKLLINTNNSLNLSGACDSNSDTGLSSMGEGDMSQLGTLV